MHPLVSMLLASAAHVFDMASRRGRNEWNRREAGGGGIVSKLTGGIESRALHATAHHCAGTAPCADGLRAARCVWTRNCRTASAG